ncbi:MAG TPA: rhomboid family intramembrane serine protease [Planctomycetota bacterium]|nr:rhomboid family intramembrane serine protease [Planctomycetota bacterium]
MSDRDYWRDTEGRPSGFWATYPATKAILIGLAGIHVLVTLVTGANPQAYGDILDLLGLSVEGTLRQLRVWQLLTCALLHGGVMHLLWNCLGIFIFGRLVEERLGTGRYLRFLLGAQLSASLGFLLLSSIQSTVIPMIGASGVDFGLLVLCAFWYPNLQIYIFFILRAPLWIAAALFVFIEAMMLLERGGGIAHSAHLAGALYGFVYYRWVGEFDQLFAFLGDWQRKRDQRRLELERRRREALRGQVDAILDKVNRDGMAALTDEERRVLKEASERLRR